MTKIIQEVSVARDQIKVEMEASAATDQLKAELEAREMLAKKEEQLAETTQVRDHIIIDLEAARIETTQHMSKKAKITQDKDQLMGKLEGQ